MDITIFKHARDVGKGRLCSISFSNITGLSHQVTEDKLATQLLFYGKLKNDSRAKPMKAVYRDGLVLDFDHNKVDITERIKKSLAGYQYILYSTFSHDPDNKDYCHRVLINTTESIKPEDYFSVYWNFVNNNPELKQLSDEDMMDHSAKDETRSFFAPSTHPKRQDKVYKYIAEGIPLKPDTTRCDKGENNSSNKDNQKVPLPDLLVGVKKGERHNACVRIAGLLFSRDIPIEWVTELMLGWNKRCDPPRDEQEVINEVIDIGNRHQIKTINDLVEAQQIIEPTEYEDEITYTFLTKKDRESRPVIDWYIKQLQRDSGIGAIIGQESNGKTNVATDLACRISKGMDFFGHETREPKPVIYIPLEDWVGVDLRLRAWEQYHGIEPNVLLLNEECTLNFTEGEGIVKKFISDCKVQALTGVVIFFDTFQYLVEGMDENGQKDMSVATKYLKMISKELKSFVWYLHHMGKDKTKGSRGSSLINASHDSRISIHNNAELHIEKVKGAKSDIRYSYETDIIDLGNGADAIVLTATSKGQDKRKELTGKLQVAVFNFIKLQFAFNLEIIAQCNQESSILSSISKDKLIELTAEFLGTKNPDTNEFWVKTNWKRKSEAIRIINDLTGKPYNKLGMIVGKDQIEYIYLLNH